MSRIYTSNELELYDCSRIEIQVPSSYEKLFLLVFQLISLFIFSCIYIDSQGKTSLVPGNRPLFGPKVVILENLTCPDFLHMDRTEQNKQLFHSYIYSNLYNYEDIINNIYYYIVNLYIINNIFINNAFKKKINISEVNI